MTCRACVAFNEATTLPYVSLVVEGERFVLVDAGGEVSGGVGVLQRIVELFGGDGLDVESAFGMYAAAFGCSPSPSAVIPVGFDASVEYMQRQLLLGQGSGSPQRQAVLDRVASAWRGSGLDSAAVLDERLFDPDAGSESMVPAEVRERFLSGAGWEPYRYEVSRRDELAADVLAWAGEGSVGAVVVPEAVPVPEAVVVPEAVPVPAVEPVQVVPVVPVAPEVPGVGVVAGSGAGAGDDGSVDDAGSVDGGAAADGAGSGSGAGEEGL